MTLQTLKRWIWMSALATLIVGVGDDVDPPGTEVVVAFSRLRFEPATVEVRRGVRVTFHNIDTRGDPLTIVASDGVFESRRLATHGEWSHRFKTLGEHEFVIKEQPETRGKAVVR